MKRKIFNILFAVALALSLGLVIAVQTATPAQAATITTGGSGSWDSTTNNAPWPNGVVPGATDKVIIASTHTVTIPSGVTRTCGDIVITGTLDFLGTTTGELDVRGGGTSPVTTGSVSGTGTINGVTSGGCDIKLYGNWSFNGAIINVLSVAFQGPNDATVSAVSASSFRNIYFEKAANTTLYLSVTPQHNNNFYMTSGSICYNQNGAQIVKPATYPANLTLAGSGVKTTTSVTVSGVLSMEGNATASVAPTYGTSATLRYNTATARTAGAEWITPFAATGGVIIDNTGTITLNAAKTFNAGVPLTINSGATLSTNSTSNYGLTLGGDFVNNGTFTANGSAITIQGNWTNNGTFSYGTSTVTLSGTSPQTMTGATTFYNLILNNNNNGLTINNDETVSHTLTLTNGKITTGANTVIIPASGSVSRTNGWVIGNLQKNVATGSSVSRTFEVGATNYDPVIVVFTSVSVAGNLIAEATAGEHPNIGSCTIDSSKDVNVYWSFNNSGITFANYSATFNFNPGDIDVSANTTNFIVGKYSAGWTYPTVGTKNSTSTQATGMTSFSDFAVGAVNNPPTSASNTVTTPKNTTYVFSTSDFSFSDADTGDTLQKVMITTLETEGALKYDSADVTLNQEVTAANITAGKLTFVPAAGATGSPYTTFGFKVSDGRDYSSSAYTMTINVIIQVTFRSTGSSPGANSASCVITKPTGLTVGDLMIAQVVGTDPHSSSGNIGTFTAPSGWTSIRQDTAVYSTGEYLASALFWRIANATDVAASSFTFTATNANSNRGAITAWYGQDPTNPINAQNGQPNNTASITVTSPTITPSVANCMILLFCGVYNDNTESNYAIATSNPPSWAEAYDLLYNDTYDLGLSLGYGTRSQTTATGSGTATTSSSTYSTGQLLAIAPAQCALTASASSNSAVCEGATISLTGGPGGMTTYNWTGPNSFTSSNQSPSISGATLAMAGDYTLTVTDSNGCTASNTTNVVVNAKPAASASTSTPSVCEGGTVTLTGGPAGLTYNWTGPNGFNSASQSPTVSTNATLAMTGTYTLTVTNSTTGCSATNTTTVTVNAKPAATASNNGPVCEGATIQLTGGPSGAYTYSWTGPNSFTSSNQSPTISGATLAMAGAYNLTVTNSTTGCTSNSVSTTVVVNAKPTVEAGSDESACVDAPAFNLTGESPLGGTWSGTGITNGSDGNFFAATVAGNYTITYTYSDTNGCTNADTKNVEVYAKPTVEAGSDESACVDAPAFNLTGESPLGGTWSGTGITNGSDGTFDPATGAGNYTITYTYSDTNGCTNADTKNVEVYAKPIATASSNSPVSEGATIELYGGPDGMGSYSWTGPGGWTANTQNATRTGATLAMAGTYTLIVTDGGCPGDPVTTNVTVTALTYTISGIIQVGGTPLAGVLVTAHSPWTGTAITDADGKYELTGVPYGETSIHITPTLAGYTFDPPTITVTGPLTAPIENQNFAATLTGILPSTYAKIPFAIIQSGFTMVGQILDALGSTLGLPAWLNSTLLDTIGGWVGGPLSWSVDMLAWGLDLAGEVVGGLQPILTAMNVSLPLDLGDLTDLLDIVACKLLMPWNPAASTTNFTPCG